MGIRGVRSQEASDVSGTERASQEQKSQDTRKAALVPDTIVADEFVIAPAPLLQTSAAWNGLPEHPTSRGIRQASLLSIQRRQGNGYVRRMLADAPVLRLPVFRQEETGEELEPIEPVPDVEGQGEPHEEEAFGGEGIELRGLATAQYDGGSYHTEDVTTVRGDGCSSCDRGNPCVHVTGSLVTEYSVETEISLPTVPSGLTPCQTIRAQEFIDSVLEPHEREHVAAFEQYNGSTSRPFDMTLCRLGFASAITSMVEREEEPRRAAAQGTSDALDPFNRQVDLDCEEETEED